jgi:hypothetical protein
MIDVRVNGEIVAIQHASHARFTEIVELVKSVIDPDHIITDIRVNGEEPTESQWQGTVSQFGTAVVEIKTGNVEDYVSQKMAATSSILDEIFLLFRNARKLYQAANSFEGNKALGEAVRAAKAFFEWYASMLMLVPAHQREFYNIETQVTEIGETCQKICTQQLYQNWKAVAETIEKDLEPKLDGLESFSRRFESAAKAA